jgi:hypothetical protein
MDLCNLQTLLGSLVAGKPGGRDIYTSSFKSPCKKALFTSNYSRCHPLMEGKASKTIIVVILATGEKVSK